MKKTLKYILIGILVLLLIIGCYILYNHVKYNTKGSNDGCCSCCSIWEITCTLQCCPCE